MSETPSRDSGPVMLGSGEFQPLVSRDDAPIVVRSSGAAWAVAILALVLGAGAVGVLLYGRADLSAALQKAEHDKAVLAADVALAKAEARAKAEEAKALTQERDALSSAKQATEAELARLRATQEELATQVRSELITGDITLQQDGAVLTVGLVDKLLFDSGQAEISPKGRELLARLGGVLAKVEDRMIQVVGHTDDAVITGKIKDKFPTNWELSVARATTVVRFLEEEAHVPGKRIAAVGRSQYEPVASNIGPKGRAKNRRIEILLTPAVVAARRVE